MLPSLHSRASAVHAVLLGELVAFGISGSAYELTQSTIDQIMTASQKQRREQRTAVKAMGLPRQSLPRPLALPKLGFHNCPSSSMSKASAQLKPHCLVSGSQHSAHGEKHRRQPFLLALIRTLGGDADTQSAEG